MRILGPLVVVLGLGLTASEASAVSLIINGGFEIGNFTPVGGGIRACRHLSQTSAHTRCSPARKFRAVFS